jgi:hypothetical protein
MKVTPDTITTALGVVGAAVTAATPVLNVVQGTLHAQDWLQLVSAVFIAVFGFFTNKAPKQGNQP